MNRFWHFSSFFYLQDKVKSCRYCCSPTPIQLPIAALTACALPVYCSRLHVLHNEKSVITARCPCRSTVLPTIECNWLRKKSLNSFRRLEIVNLLTIYVFSNTVHESGVKFRLSEKHTEICAIYLILCTFTLSKANSVQEACVKCFAVHISKFEILQITRKKMKQRTSDP